MKRKAKLQNQTLNVIRETSLSSQSKHTKKVTSNRMRKGNETHKIGGGGTRAWTTRAIAIQSIPGRTAVSRRHVATPTPVVKTEVHLRHVSGTSSPRVCCTLKRFERLRTLNNNRRCQTKRRFLFQRLGFPATSCTELPF